MGGFEHGSHGVNSDPVPKVNPSLNAIHLMKAQMLSDGGVKDWSKIPMPKAGLATHITMIAGALWTLGSLIAVFIDRNFGIPIILGIFMLLASSILYARVSRQRLNIVRAYCVRGWRNEEIFKAPIGRVLRYTFFSLLPVYCMWCLPVMLGLFVGYSGWLSLGVPFLIISAVAFASFSVTWKDLEIKLWKFWLYQFGIYAVINGMGLLIYFFGA